jgi:hypothetical protein
VGFTRGMIHLVRTLNLSTVGVSSSDWSFGQVVPIVLLAAPAIAVVEFFYEGEVSVQSTACHTEMRLEQTMRLKNMSPQRLLPRLRPYLL